MENQENELRLEGRHSVMEAFRAGKLIERLFVLKGCQDGPVLSILREAKKAGVMVDFVPKERLDHMSESGKHVSIPLQYGGRYVCIGRKTGRRSLFLPVGWD